MDRKYLSNCKLSNFRAGFFNMEEAIQYSEDFKKDCRNRRIYCEETFNIDNTNKIIVNINIWELPEDNLEN